MAQKVKLQDIAGPLAELAQKVVEEAMRDGVDLELRLECLKIGTAYLVGSTKANAKTVDEDNVITFDNLKQRMKEADHG